MLIAYLVVFSFCIGVFFKPKEFLFLFCASFPIIYNLPVRDFVNGTIPLCVLLSFILHSGRVLSWKRNVFVVPIILQCVSIFVSNYLSAFPHNGLAFRSIISLTTVLVIGYYFSKAEDSYIAFCLKVLKVLCVLVFVDALIELITFRNPFNEFMLSIGTYDRSTVATYIDIRYGLKRCQSVFGMKTTLGGFGLILFCVFTFAKYIGKEKIHQIYIIMALMMVFVSGTRSVMLGTIVASLMFFSKKIHKQLNQTQIIVGVCILLIFSGSYLMNVLTSFFETESVNGSNSDMRRIQFELALYYMTMHPIWGNGLSYSWTHVVARFSKEALGLESVWFPIMIDRGIVGCFVYLSFYLVGCWKAMKKGGLIIAFSYAGWLVASSMSSLPGLTEIFYLPLFLFLHAIISRQKC